MPSYRAKGAKEPKAEEKPGAKMPKAARKAKGGKKGKR